MKSFILQWLFLSLAVADRLDSYNILPDSTTVSGISSGACFATQMHVAHSSLIKGMGSFAGVTYYCAEANVVQGVRCTNATGLSGVELADEARRFESEGKIDQTLHLDNSTVFVLHGQLDESVHLDNVDDMVDFYLEFMDQENITTVTHLPLVHGWPTEDYGTPCNETNSDLYINYCNYHGAFVMLDTFYGPGLQRPNSSTPTPGDWYEFDQTEFLLNNSMDEFGFAYIPTGCIDKQTACRLHVSFHGCLIARWSKDDEFALNTFINHVGELNDIIILYPQVQPSAPENPMGCWDWWGYNDFGPDERGNYATRLGSQITAIYDMIQRVTGADS